MPYRTLCVATVIVSFSGGCAPTARPPSMSRPSVTIVLVHGAFAGGWSFRQVGDRLSADGYRVYRPTLTGVGERVHLAAPNVNLTTNIDDIVNLIQFEDLHNIVLVGHSYGGMVITGVVDRIHERIGRVIYLDAMVPLDGESAWQEVSHLQHHHGPVKPDGTGYLTPTWVLPLERLPHDVPQPGDTFAQPIQLAQSPQQSILPTTYVLYIPPDHPVSYAIFFYFYERAKSFGWDTRTLVSDHNAQHSHSLELAYLIERIVEGH
jgi:pimeloyl-ACP methyl ester carboxylesterase